MMSLAVISIGTGGESGCTAVEENGTNAVDMLRMVD